MDSGRRVLCLLSGTVGDIKNQSQEIWRVGGSVASYSGCMQEKDSEPVPWEVSDWIIMV